jgi:LDH2 family malate/lactate/ureidoglycolate dehydrogenase
MSAPATVRLAEAELLELATRALRGHGLAEADAADAARVLVLADLFGVTTHGVMRVASYGERLDSGGIKARPAIAVERTAPGLARVDGDNGVGPLVGMRALAAAMEGARACGIGAAFARNSNHFGPIASYALLAAEAGFASIIGSNATTTIAPTGGSEAKLGNNPLGLCVPRPGGMPVMLDMAMSVVARAKIRRAADRGESIPDSWATDRAGRPTTDPRAALDGFLAPIGGYKGYGLALLVDLFAGLLSGAAYLTHVKSWVDEPDLPQNLGHFFILVDTTKLGLGSLLADRVDDFRAILHGTPAYDPGNPVKLPGEMELERLARQRRDGIVVEADVIDMLKRAAARVA